MTSVRERPSSRDEWLGIEIRHLLAFDAIARGRSFSAAADQLGYVQSAVSHQLAHLERLVGARLLNRERGPKPVSLTPAGELLLEHARDLLDSFDAAREALDAFADGRTGSLRLGLLSDGDPSVVCTLLERLRASFPHLALSLWESGRDAAILERLAEGAIDLAMTELPLTDSRICTAGLGAEPRVLAVAAGVPEAADPYAALRTRVPVIVAGSNRSAARILARLRAKGIAPASELRVQRASVARSLAAGGLGVAILPASAVDASDPQLVIHELVDVLPMRLTGLAWRQGNDEAGVVAAALQRPLA